MKTSSRLSFRAERGISLWVFSTQCEIPRRPPLKNGGLLGMTRKLGLSDRLQKGGSCENNPMMKEGSSKGVKHAKAAKKSERGRSAGWRTPYKS